MDRHYKFPHLLSIGNAINIQLKLEHEYPAGLLPLSQLKEHGLGQVQIQARPDRNLSKFLGDIDRNLLEGDEGNGE